jgi:hypothetical protein
MSLRNVGELPNYMLSQRRIQYPPRTDETLEEVSLRLQVKEKAVKPFTEVG